MTVPVIHVDTFVETGLRGNAAAVCVLEGPANSSWMQSIAHEMNVSETAFFYRESDGSISAGLARWWKWTSAGMGP